MDLFSYRDYRAYLNDWIAAQPKRGRGLRLQIAREVSCHTAYVTFVLSGKTDFSLEQGVALSGFLGHAREEQHFFLLLIELARAGTEVLRKYFREQIEAVVEHRSALKNRLEFKRALSEADQLTYYSNWQYGAVHMAVSASHLQTRDALARYFGLSAKRVGEILRFLSSVGLAVEEKGYFKLGTSTLHLAHDSPTIAKHHTNWRMQAIASLDQENSNDLHYSSVTMISEKDAETIRAALVRAIEEVRKTVRESKEEQCYAYAVDLFRVGK